ncbi:MAG: T9SS type A sorting domain-containing protein [Bacteroidetes bacterium]|nr:T9SS type A sorting domain-containing protein [Bacteroidota bacterium]MBL7103208.1 T9SS type A sorting domain-containing protein [Bacteroidales bacterium]
MKRQIKSLVIILLFVPNIAISQNTFIKWISSPKDEIPWDIYKLNSNNQYLLSIVQGTVSSNPGYYDIFFNYNKIIHITDYEFNFLDSLFLDNIEGYLITPGKVIITDVDEILLWGTALDTNTYDEQLYLQWLDYDLNILKDSLYGLPDRNDAMAGFTVTYNNNIVFFRSYPISKQEKYDSVKYVLWEFDIQGNEINYNTDTIHSAIFIGISDMTGIDKYQVTSVNKIIYFNYNLEYDTAVSWQVEKFTGYRTKKINDSEYFIIGSIDNMMPPYINENFDMAFLVIDENANIQTINSYGVLDTNDREGDIDFINIDTLFFGGTKNYTCGAADTWFTLYKTNYDGDIFFTRYYGGHGKYSLHRVITTDDGGCVMVGTYWDFYNYPNPKQHDIVIMKVDENGLISNLDEHIPFEVTDIIVYPNPGNDFIKINTALQNLVFTLFDIKGDQIMEKEFDKSASINTQHLQVGIYLYKIQQFGKEVKSGKWIKQ